VSLTAKVVLGVALVAGVLFCSGLGSAPFVDPPEGFHAAIAWEMLRHGNWITPHFNGVRYFDKPPLLYWLMAGAFRVLGPGEAVGRLGSALPALGVAALTAWLGMRLGGARVGLIAGLVVAANLELFLFARLVKPDLLLVLCILVAFAGFLDAYLRREEGRDGRWGLLIFYAALGATVLAKDLLGAVGPLATIALFFAVTRERNLTRRWIPWAGVLVFLVIAVPWYALVEAGNPGFLWYAVVDNHLLNLARHRVFPDEDVPLSALEFLAVTAIGFLPWCLAVPWALWRRLRGPWPTAQARAWLLLALWATGSLAVFTLSPFKLPHYGLPAFPALALLVAKLWDEVLEGTPDAPSPRTLLVPPLLLFAAAAGAAFLAWAGYLALPAGALSSADVASRDVAVRGADLPFMTAEQLAPLFSSLAAVFGLGALVVALGLARRRPAVGLGALLAAMLAVLPFSAEGFALFARSRSVGMLSDAVVLRAVPGDLLAHEGALENSGSWLLALNPPGGMPPGAGVKVVNGLVSNLAFGATFPEARNTFWDSARLAAAWGGARRVFLLSASSPGRSVTRALPPESVHLLLDAGGRRLYSNRP
jgi:4-amino-4-deoxy-L-arabinose transferase-like glycosyltransferase